MTGGSGIENVQIDHTFNVRSFFIFISFVFSSFNSQFWNRECKPPDTLDPFLIL